MSFKPVPLSDEKIAAIVSESIKNLKKNEETKNVPETKTSVVITSSEQISDLLKSMSLADDSSRKIELLTLIKCIQDVNLLKLFIQNDGLQLLWTWTIGLTDVYLKNHIMEVLMILPKLNTRRVKESKIFDVVKSWRNQEKTLGVNKRKDGSKKCLELPLTNSSSSQYNNKQAIRKRSLNDHLNVNPSPQLKDNVVTDGNGERNLTHSKDRSEMRLSKTFKKPVDRYSNLKGKEHQAELKDKNSGSQLDKRTKRQSKSNSSNSQSHQPKTRVTERNIELRPEAEASKDICAVCNLSSPPNSDLAVIDWIVCDVCNQWLHHYCINTRLAPNEKYICGFCLHVNESENFVDRSKSSSKDTELDFEPQKDERTKRQGKNNTSNSEPHHSMSNAAQRDEINSETKAADGLCPVCHLNSPPNSDLTVIDWISCDVCSQWFHQNCINTLFSSNEIYICDLCV